MQFNMHYLIQKLEYDDDGYSVPIGQTHLSDNLHKTFCGRKIGDMKPARANTNLAIWIVDITTCKTCKSIATKKLNNKSAILS